MEGWSVLPRDALLAIVLVLLTACQGQTSPAQVSEGGAGTPTATTDLREAPPFGQVTGGRPLTWSTCAPLRWVLVPGRADPEAQTAIRTGVERILDLAGLESRFEGATDEAPVEPYDILVQVVAHETTDLLSREEWGSTEISRRGLHWTSATISLSRDGVGVLDMPGAPFDWETLAMHETGHAVGLSHTTDTGSLMHPTLELAAAAPSEEDLAALEQLRATASCPG